VRGKPWIALPVWRWDGNGPPFVNRRLVMILSPQQRPMEATGSAWEDHPLGVAVSLEPFRAPPIKSFYEEGYESSVP
jgi:hypothetical protein